MRKVLLTFLMVLPTIIWAQNERVTEIFGVPFGCSYEQAKQILQKADEEVAKELFGKYKQRMPMYWGGQITFDEIPFYKNRTLYEGIHFSHISFSFAKAGDASYFDEAFFTIKCKNKAEAKEKFDELRTALAEKYSLIDGYDDKGKLVAYGGGDSPLDPDDVAFRLFVPTDEYVYLMFGPYGYGK